ncbi:transposase [Breznakia sp. PFB1-11]|uniref:transposase n=1 Tax=Breznakia sp. PFB1-11 TaxID=2940521 RepID=UPI003F8D3C22
MKKLLLHIPEQQFKIIRYYGIYATCNHSHNEKMKVLLPRLGKAKAADRKNKFLHSVLMK